MLVFILPLDYMASFAVNIYMLVSVDQSSADLKGPSIMIHFTLYTFRILSSPRPPMQIILDPLLFHSSLFKPCLMTESSSPFD